MRPKPFLKLDRFKFNKASLTDRLRGMVDNFGNTVIRSWNSTRPIEVIRLTGHTDSTGEEKYNVGLGDRRAQVVEAALKDKLKGLLARVKIVVKPSPGETQPTADDRTSDGRDRNRRVEVFIETGVLTPPTPPTKRKSIWDFSDLTPPEESVIRTKPDSIFQPIPLGPKATSLEVLLDELLSGVSSRWLRRKIRNAVLSGACALLEVLFTQAGGQLREKDKEELGKQCLRAAKDPIT